MKNIYLLLGSNRGDRLNYLNQAAAEIAKLGTVCTISEVYESSPWAFEDEISFLNQVIELDTDFGADLLLERLLTIEAGLGRVRMMGAGCGVGSDIGYSARTIDIDILFYGSKIIFNDNLMVPHPRLHERRFTLVPMAEIAGEFVHPILRKSISELLGICTDKGIVNIF